MHIILNLLTFHGDVFLEDRTLLTPYGVQCKFSVTVTVTVSSLFFHVHNTKPVKSGGLFCKLIFVDVVVQFYLRYNLVYTKLKENTKFTSGKIKPQRIYHSVKKCIRSS